MDVSPEDESEPRRAWWTEFRSWHGDPQLYRHIYTQAMGALTAAFLIYVVAAMAGLVSRIPVVVVTGVAWLVVVGVVVAGFVRDIKDRREPTPPRGWLSVRHDRVLRSIQGVALALSVVSAVVVAVSWATANLQ